jgi:FHA domain-containing protein
MLTIRVVSFKGRPLDRELAARFEEAGGTIGRGEANTLVLSDPERFISRTHATISFQAGGYVITDTGAKNPIVVNGRPLGSGSQARLGDGDKIKVGDYLLEVAVTAHRAPQAASSGVGAWPQNPFDPFADFLSPADRSASRADPVIPPQASPVGPTQTPSGPPRSPEFSADDPFVGIRGREPSLDDLFGLKSSASPDLLAPEAPLGKSPGSSPSSGGVVDPLDMFLPTVKPAPPAPSVPDHGPELFTPYAPPQAKPEPVLKPKAEPPQASLRAPAAPLSQPVSAAPSGPPEQALLRAFLQGAGIPGTQIKNLTPETMETIGKLLREAVQGTLDLLQARGLLKSEMRADVTMIMAQDNNPLKFSPSVEVALTHLLAPQAHGFIPPLRAMKDAYDDLRAHQLGFLAGMRAALEEVLARFSPQELTKRLSGQSMLDNMLPMNRKAKLWDLFIERHATISGEAREDFNTAFGKAFRRAYEAQVKRLRDGPGLGQPRP